MQKTCDKEKRECKSKMLFGKWLRFPQDGEDILLSKKSWLKSTDGKEGDAETFLRKGKMRLVWRSEGISS